MYGRSELEEAAARSADVGDNHDEIIAVADTVIVRPDPETATAS